MNEDAPDPGPIVELQPLELRPVDPVSPAGPTSLRQGYGGPPKLQRSRKVPALLDGELQTASAGLVETRAAAPPQLSRTFRLSSALAGLAAGLALIAYGEGLFTAPPPEAKPIASVPTTIPTVSPPAASAPAAAVTKARPRAPRGAAAKNRPAGSKRTTSAERAGTTVRPVQRAEKPRRRNLLGLRTVADWIAGRSKTNRPGEAGKPGKAGR